MVAIFIDSLQRFGLVQADRYHGGLEATFEFLATVPEAARTREEIDSVTRAYPVASHVIIYEIDEDGVVVVLRVRHGRENWIAQPR